MIDGMSLLTVSGLIDCGVTLNFTTQIVIKRLSCGPGVDLPHGVRTIDGTALRTYQLHTLNAKVVDSVGNERVTKADFIAADFVGFDIILGSSWLIQEEPEIA